MIRVPGLLLIGAESRNLGKTGLSCEIISRVSPQQPLVAVKATVISDERNGCHRPDGGCGSCAMAEPYRIIEETSSTGAKDTARMLAAGASRVFWLKTRVSAAAEAIQALLKSIGHGVPIICEGNRVRKFAEPDLFLMLKGKDTAEIKPGAQIVEDYADVFITTGTSGERGFDTTPLPEWPTEGRMYRGERGHSVTVCRIDSLSLHSNRWCLKRDATAIILAGGQSSRMGTDKSLLRRHGDLLIERTLNTLRPHFTHLMVSANDPDKFKSSGVTVIPDRQPGEGPLMAIASVLEASQTDLHFIMACDMPGFNADLFNRLMRAVRGYDAVIPTHGGRHEPLFAVYRKSVLPMLRSSLLTGNRKITAALEGAKVNYLEIPARDVPINLNTPADLEAFLRSPDAHA